MTARTRIVLVGVVVFLAIAGLVTLLAPRSDSPTPVASSAVASQIQTTTESTAATPTETVTPDAVSTAEPEAAEQLKTGRGRIYGAITLPPTATPGLPITVYLHRVAPNDAREFTLDYTLLTSVVANADGSYELPKLPFDSYVVIAACEGYTNNSDVTVSKDHPESEVRITLVPSGSIAGKVVNEKHEPVSGARVFIAGWDIGNSKMNAPLGRALASQQITGDDGTFTMPYLRRQQPGEQGYRLAVKANGYATTVSDYVAAPAAGLELTLAHGGVVSGMLVRKDTGAPLPDKVITVESQTAIDRLSTRSDADGFFFLTDLAIGSHRAQLQDPELVIVSESATFQASLDENAPDVVLQAAPGGVLAGRVTDAASGRGIAKAEIEIAPIQAVFTAVKNLVTDADGRFHVGGLPQGQYRVYLSTPAGYSRSGNSENRQRFVAARLGEETGGIDFVLMRGLLLTGRVVDENGKPLVDASVHGETKNTNDSERTGADGTFTLAGFEPDMNITVYANKTNYTMLSREPKGELRMDDDGIAGVTLIMGKSSSISGIVVTKAGVPKPGVRMWVRSPTQFRPGSSVETSGADGSITFDDLAPGEYSFRFNGVRVVQVSGQKSQEQTVTVGKEERLTGIRIVYPEVEGGVLAGRVVDTHGVGIAGAHIEVQYIASNETTTDADGRYRIEGLPEKMIELQVTGPKHLQAGISAEVPNENFIITLLECASIKGRVVSARTGQPLPAFRARPAIYTTDRIEPDEYESFSDPTGAFALTKVKEESNTVEVRADGYADKRVTIPPVQAGQAVTDLVVRLDDAVVLNGRVLDTTGKGIAGAQLTVGKVYRHDGIDDDELRGASGSDGSFSINSLGIGTVTLSAAHPEYAIKTTTVNLAGTQNNVDIVLDPGATLEGVVTVDGKPTRDQRILIEMAGGYTSYDAETNTQGRYRIAGLPDGNASINAEMEGFGNRRSKRHTAEVSNGRVTTVDFHFQTTGSTIEGTIYTGPNEPLQTPAHLNLLMEQPNQPQERMNGRSDPSGSFRFDNVPAGSATLSVIMPNNTGQKAVRFEVGDNQRIRQDILFYGGATARVHVSGTTQPTTIILLYPGTIQLSELSQESMQTLRNKVVSAHTVENGEAVIKALEPGDYTLLCMSWDPEIPRPADAEPYAFVAWTTQTFSIEKDKEMTVNVQF